jgi:hypothetical protein
MTFQHPRKTQPVRLRAYAIPAQSILAEMLQTAVAIAVYLVLLRAVVSSFGAMP